MKKVLVVNSSLSAEQGQSSKLLAYFIEQLPANVIIERIDLNQQPLPHLSMNEIASWMTPAAERSSEQAELAAISDGFVAQVQQADVVLIGVPMYNFGISSGLKAFFDRLARAGLTFKYTAEGPVGLLTDKPVIFFATRGGIYQNLPADTQTPFLKTFFNFLGLKNLHFVYAEGLNMGDDSAQSALVAAHQHIDLLRQELVG